MAAKDGNQAISVKITDVTLYVLRVMAAQKMCGKSELVETCYKFYTENKDKFALQEYGATLKKTAGKMSDATTLFSYTDGFHRKLKIFAAQKGLRIADAILVLCLFYKDYANDPDVSAEEVEEEL